MRFNYKNQLGSLPIILVIAAAVIALVGFLGYVAYDRFIVGDKAVVITEQSAVADDMKTVTESVPVGVTDIADLDEAITVLNQITDDETTQDVNIIDEQTAAF